MSAGALPADLDAAIDRSAAPARVRAAIDRLAEVRPGLGPWLAGHDGAPAALVAVIAASRSLSRQVQRSPVVIDAFAHLDRRQAREDTTIDDLVGWKQREFLRIAARDLVGLDTLEEATAALAELASDVLDGACQRAAADDGHRDANDVRLAVIGMGKLGGNELNYSSDIDIMFVGDGPPVAVERRARAVSAIARRCFRVDTNLRPQGRDGPLARTIDSYEAHWDRWAEPWEFQALLKARPVAGDEKLGMLFGDTAQRWLWSHPFASDDLRSLRRMKHRAETQVARQGLAEREVKLGRGGIRDIEFTVQLLQLVHGHADVDLRSPNTLDALNEMATAGYVDPVDARALAEAYRFLRLIEHRLQLVDEQQIHTVPTDPTELDQLARVVGYRDRVTADAGAQLEHDLLHHQLAVRSIHERVYFRPLLEAFAAGSSLSPEAAVARLTAFGFTDADRTQVAIRELTRGLNRSSRLMQQLLPLMLDWLSDSPNPDLGLLMLRNLLSGPQRTTPLIEAFRDSPEVARRLCLLVGTSRLIADVLVHHPDLAVRLPDTNRLQTSPRDTLIADAHAAIGWRADKKAQQVALRRWKDRHLFGIAARDVLGYADVAAVGHDLTALAEASVASALDVLAPQVPFCVLAMGRFGGAELSYASDLDVIFVYDGEAGEAQRVAGGLLRFLGGATPTDQLYEVDAGLRPEGKQGPLARSRDGFLNYWQRYALVWERQAMTQARPVAGDLDLGARLLADLDERIWVPGLDNEGLRDMRLMKARIERERIPFGEDPQFHLKLGRGSLSDIEFTAQLLQLQHGVRTTGTMATLEALITAGVLDPDDGDILMTSYRFCERARNRWYLVNSKPGDSLPNSPEQLLWLSRSLEVTPNELRDSYRRVTRRARRVVERLFYGTD